MTLPPCLAVVAIVVAGFVVAQGGSPNATSTDQDGDGLSDRLEGELLARFAPVFLIATDDCAGAPVEFTPGLLSPQPTSVFGVIYGQAFPVSLPAKPGSFIEVHYYHLWNRDCGRRGHPLDVEHVSALLRSDRLTDPPERWSAVYWYAAAHEGTACDAGNGADAERIHADSNGPDVWVSRGKHASYLSPDLCMKGCGGDSCASSTPLHRTALINIGERGAPMNGATWAESPIWHLNAKMGTDFTADVITAIEASSEGAVLLRPRTRAQSLIAVGNASANRFTRHRATQNR